VTASRHRQEGDRSLQPLVRIFSDADNRVQSEQAVEKRTAYDPPEERLRANPVSPVARLYRDLFLNLNLLVDFTRFLIPALSTRSSLRHRTEIERARISMMGDPLKWSV
jgi:hypothetical protein